MKNGIASLLLVCICYSSTLSQDVETIGYKRITITTGVFDYVPSLRNTANINLGTEIYLQKRKSLLLNFGVIKSYGPSPQGSFVLPLVPSSNTIGIKIQIEGRHYLNRRKLFEPAILLFAPHIFQYKTQNFENTGYYIALHSSLKSLKTKLGSNSPFLSEQDYSLELISGNLKFGYQCIRNSGLTIDFGIGIGGLYVLKNTAQVSEPASFSNSYYNKKLRLNGIYQFRIGWAF